MIAHCATSNGKSGPQDLTTNLTTLFLKVTGDDGDGSNYIRLALYMASPVASIMPFSEDRARAAVTLGSNPGCTRMTSSASMRTAATTLASSSA